MCHADAPRVPCNGYTDRRVGMGRPFSEPQQRFVAFTKPDMMLTHPLVVAELGCGTASPHRAPRRSTTSISCCLAIRGA